MTGQTAGVGRAYDTSASTWAVGPAVVYEALADALVAVAPHPLAGARVLDLGAGTGSGARAARRAGAGRVVGVDVAPAMLRAGSGWDGVVVADASSLPLADASFDLVVAAFSLGHLDDPGAALAESGRVARSVLASAFRAGWTHPAKAVVDAVAARFGFVVPSWYARVKAVTEPAVDDPGSLAVLARQAGYSDVAVTAHRVDVGVRTAAQMTAWRLGMAHLAPFVGSLEPARRADLRRCCALELRSAPPVIVPMIALAASSR